MAVADLEVRLWALQVVVIGDEDVCLLAPGASGLGRCSLRDGGRGSKGHERREEEESSLHGDSVELVRNGWLSGKLCCDRCYCLRGLRTLLYTSLPGQAYLCLELSFSSHS